MESSTAVQTALSWLFTARAEKAKSQEIENKLIRLKELTRNKQNAQPLYTRTSFLLLYSFAFAHNSTSPVAADEAKRCLANALTLEDHCVSIFLETDGFDAVFGSDANTVGNCTYQDEFLYARILFLVTGKRGSAMKEDVQVYQKAFSELTSRWLTRHWRWAVEEDSIQTVDTDEAEKVVALIETLKLCFNISLYSPDILNAAFPVDDHINAEALALGMITRLQTRSESQTRTVIPHLINLLTTVGSTRNNTRKVTAYLAIFRLLNGFVDAMLSRTNWNEKEITEDHMIPLLTVLSNIYNSYVSDTEAQDYIKSLLIVPSAERIVPLGRSDSSQGKLLQLMNSAGPRVRDCISTLLFQVSDGEPTKFVENVGYGHAIGFLTAKGIALTPEEIHAEHGGQGINPITGQNLRDEEYEQAQKGLADMTEEEKEREAERLFVLFERLKKNGIIDVKNPVQQAVDKGRFQEM